MNARLIVALMACAVAAIVLSFERAGTFGEADEQRGEALRGPTPPYVARSGLPSQVTRETVPLVQLSDRQAALVSHQLGQLARMEQDALKAADDELVVRVRAEKKKILSTAALLRD